MSIAFTGLRQATNEYACPPDYILSLRMIVSRTVYMSRRPRGSYIVYPSLSLEVATPENKYFLIRRCHSYARKSASKPVHGRMQLTLHTTRPTPHGASRLVQAVFAWSVKTRRAPSRHCRYARVYGHTTTATHDMSNPPSPLLPSPCLLYTSPSPRD